MADQRKVRLLLSRLQPHRRGFAMAAAATKMVRPTEFIRFREGEQAFNPEQKSTRKGPTQRGSWSAVSNGFLAAAAAVLDDTAVVIVPPSPEKI